MAQQLFQCLDVNGDGEMDLEEFSELYKGEYELDALQKMVGLKGGGAEAEKEMTVEQQQHRKKIHDQAKRAAHSGMRFHRTGSVQYDLLKQVLVHVWGHTFAVSE
jgi:hypothetical protein